MEEKALNLIARQSTGSLRDAISMLDQLSSLGGTLTLSITQNVLGTATNQVVIDLVDAILSGDAKKGISSIHLALDAGSDPRQIARQIVDYLRTLLLIQMNSTQFSDLNQELYQVSSKQARSFSQDHLIQAIKSFNTAATEPKRLASCLLLELALAEALETAPVSGAKSNTRNQLKFHQQVNQQILREKQAGEYRLIPPSYTQPRLKNQQPNPNRY